MQEIAFADDAIGRQIRDRLGDKWTVPVVYALARRALHFGEISRALRVTAKVLTGVLRSLDRDGLILRVDGTSAGQVQYMLTPLGRSFLRLAAGVERWAKQHQHEVVAARRSFTAPQPRNLVQCPQSRVFAIGTGDRPVGDTAVQSAPPLQARNDLSHICVAVADIVKSARAYAQVLGVPEPPIRSGNASLAGGDPVHIKICCFQLRNFQIELIEQLAGSSPYREFISRYGDGVQHLGLDIGHGLQESVRRLERIGGRWTAGAPGMYADLDFRNCLGTTVQLMTSTGPIDRLGGREDLPTTPVAYGRGALAARSVSHIGIVVNDVEQAARMYSQVLGIAMPQIRTRAAVSQLRRVPPAQTRIARISHGGISVELIEPVGRSSPWRRHLEQYGSGVHHIAFNVRNRLEDTIHALELNGGRAVCEGSERSVYVDLTSRLGLSLELHDLSNR